jgi:hypothetical protein
LGCKHPQWLVRPLLCRGLVFVTGAEPAECVPPTLSWVSHACCDIRSPAFGVTSIAVTLTYRHSSTPVVLALLCCPPTKEVQQAVPPHPAQRPHVSLQSASAPPPLPPPPHTHTRTPVHLPCTLFLSTCSPAQRPDGVAMPVEDLWEWSPVGVNLPSSTRTFHLPPTFIASRNLPPVPRGAGRGAGTGTGSGEEGPVRFQAVFRVRVCASVPAAGDVWGPWSTLSDPVWLCLQPKAE